MSKQITVLFQGDSITDGNRERERLDSSGSSYCRLVRAEIGYDNPNKYVFINKGINGNRIVHLYERNKTDVIDLSPDYLSILVGVNDAFHEYMTRDDSDAKMFEEVYCTLIEEIKAALPNVKIAIMEPFCLPGVSTESTETEPDKWNVIRSGVEKRAEKAKKVAEKYGLIFIPLLDKFDEAATKTEPSYWLRDGVHPTPEGHELIKRAWMKAMGLSI